MRGTAPTLTGKAFSDAFFEQHPDARSVIRLFDYLPSALFYAKDDRHRYVAMSRRTLADVFGLDDLADVE